MQEIATKQLTLRQYNIRLAHLAYLEGFHIFTIDMSSRGFRSGSDPYFRRARPRRYSDENTRTEEQSL
jgi:hypothetical protein